MVNILLLILLSYTFFLHQTTTTLTQCNSESDCLIPFFYIKPQLLCGALQLIGIVLYLFSTSNHNLCFAVWQSLKLSYTFFLHQTTTWSFVPTNPCYCLIPFFYIKPQHCLRYASLAGHCLIPFFYIKPQL